MTDVSNHQQISTPRRKKPCSEWESLLGEMEKDSLSPWVADFRKHIFQKGGNGLRSKRLCSSVAALGDEAGGAQDRSISHLLEAPVDSWEVHPDRRGQARLMGFLPGLPPDLEMWTS